MNGALVMWMAAGFGMLEAGMVRSKNVATICLKNISLFGVAGILFYVAGYNLMYNGVDGGWIGSLGLWGADDAAGSDWFFQMVFCGAACSVVSGCVAERIKFWPFIIFCAVLCGVIYPIQGSWVWGGGWLTGMGFKDFAGSTLVHSVGGWAALTGALILGARKGKFSKDGKVNPMPGSNLTLATLGTFILWMGWFGFNGGSVLSLGSADAAVSMSNVFVNTNLAACGGMMAALLLLQAVYKRGDLTMALNGALSVHLVSGIRGTLAVPLTNPEASFLTQLIGVAAIAAFVLIISTIVWMALKFTVGIRVSEEEEFAGSDTTELGLEAYPEFGRGSQCLR